jgi:hypothetical protein
MRRHLSVNCFSLLHWSISIFHHNTPVLWCNCTILTRRSSTPSLVFATMHQQPFSLSHYCRNSNLPISALTTQTNDKLTEQSQGHTKEVPEFPREENAKTLGAVWGRFVVLEDHTSPLRSRLLSTNCLLQLQLLIQGLLLPQWFIETRFFLL